YPLAPGAVRRGASARGHRAKHHQQSDAHSRRRADRQSRQCQCIRDFGPAVRFAARARSNPGYGVSRAGSGPALQAADQDEGRKRHQPAVGAGRRRGDMNHLQLAFRNLQRRPTRSILTVLGVAVAVGSFSTLYGLSRSVNENVQQAFEERGTDLTVRRRGIAEPFGGTVPESIIPDIAKIPGVAGVTGQLLTFAATDNDDHVIAFGWSEGSFFWSSVPLAEGRLPNPGERKFALVGKDIAHTLGKHIGDDITLLGDKFHLIGITNYSSVINRNAVIAGLPDLQQ